MESPVPPATRPADRIKSLISNTARRASRPRRFLHRGARHGAAIFMTLLAAGIIHSASFVAPVRSSAGGPQPAARAAGEKQSARRPAPAAVAKSFPGALPGFVPFQSGEEMVATYAADCVTPKTTFD